MAEVTRQGPSGIKRPFPPGASEGQGQKQGEITPFPSSKKKRTNEMIPGQMGGSNGSHPMIGGGGAGSGPNSEDTPLVMSMHMGGMDDTDSANNEADEDTDSLTQGASPGSTSDFNSNSSIPPGAPPPASHLIPSSHSSRKLSSYHQRHLNHARHSLFASPSSSKVTETVSNSSTTNTPSMNPMGFQFLPPESLAKEIRSYNDRSFMLSDTLVGKIERMQRDFERRLEKERKSHASQINDMKKEYENKISGMKKDIGNDYKKLEISLAETMTQMKEKEKTFRDYREETTQRIEKHEQIEESLREKISQLEADNNELETENASMANQLNLLRSCLNRSSVPTRRSSRGTAGSASSQQSYLNE